MKIKTKNWLPEKTNKIHKSLARLRNEEKTQIVKMRNESITTALKKQNE